MQKATDAVKDGISKKQSSSIFKVPRLYRISTQIKMYNSYFSDTHIQPK